MKPQYNILLFVLTLSLVRCTTENVVATDNPIQLPKVNLRIGNGEYIDTSVQLSSTSYLIENSSKSQTEINLSDLKYYNESFNLIQDSLPFSMSNNLELIIDSAQEFTIKYHDNTIPPPSIIDAEGNYLSEYHPPYDSIKVLPAFILNYSDSIQGIEHHDGKFIMIQEALTRNGIWKPIEYFSYSGCGNSYGVYQLDKSCHLMFPINKYKGDYHTSLRVRLKTHNKTLISNVFKGYINEEQFTTSEMEHMHHNYLKDGY